MFDPWKYAATRHPDVHVDTYADLPKGLLGLTDGATIWLSKRLTQAARRCTMTHEIAHIERGAPPTDIAWLERREHRTIDRVTARRLIDLDAFIDAVALRDGTIDLTVADDLWVDWPTLLDFVDALTPEERTMIDAELDRRAA